MPSLTEFFSQIEHSTIAITVRDSTVLTGTLSGLHLIGLTLLVGSVLVSSAGLAGLLVNDQPMAEITRATRRASVAGLIISGTGLYYAGSAEWRNTLVWGHRVLGLLLPLCLAAHWAAGRRWANKLAK